MIDRLQQHKLQLQTVAAWPICQEAERLCQLVGAFPTSVSQYQYPAALDLLAWAVSQADEYDLDPIPVEVLGYLLSLSPVRAVTVLFQLEEFDPMEESPDIVYDGPETPMNIAACVLAHAHQAASYYDIS